MAGKRITNRQLLEEINSLKTAVEQIDVKVNESKKEKVTNARDFLLVEFQNISKLFLHTDQRLESGLRIYFTAATVVLSVVVFLYDEITLTERNLPPYLLILIAFIWGGMLLTRRITRVSLQKAIYREALNRIRAYFVEESPLIRKYLLLPASDGQVATNEILRVAQTGTTRSGVLNMISVWNSILFGFMCVIIAWLIVPGLTLPVMATIGFLAGILSFLVLIWQRKLQLRRYRSTLEKQMGQEKRLNIPLDGQDQGLTKSSAR